jgi:hypothetical protein
MTPLIGLSPPSTEFPWQNHARAFANHLAYGATLGLTHNLLRYVGDLNESDRENPESRKNYAFYKEFGLNFYSGHINK